MPLDFAAARRRWWRGRDWRPSLACAQPATEEEAASAGEPRRGSRHLFFQDGLAAERPSAQTPANGATPHRGEAARLARRLGGGRRLRLRRRRGGGRRASVARAVPNGHGDGRRRKATTSRRRSPPPRSRSRRRRRRARRARRAENEVLGSGHDVFGNSGVYSKRVSALACTPPRNRRGRSCSSRSSEGKPKHSGAARRASTRSRGRTFRCPSIHR